MRPAARARSPLARLRESFVLRVFGCLAGILLLLSTAYSLYLVQTQRTMAEEHILEEGTAISQFLAQEVRLGVFAEDTEALGRATRAALAQRGVLAVRIFSADGRLLHGGPPAAVGANPAASSTAWQETQAVLARAPVPLHRETADRITFWAPVFGATAYGTAEGLYFRGDRPGGAASPLIGCVSVSLSKRPMEERLHAVVVRGVTIAVAFLLLGAAGTFFLVRAVTRPLSRLVERVQGSGIPPPSGGDEIGLLTDTFGRMVRQLDESFETINRLKGGLEETVEERTRELADRQTYLQDANRRLGDTLRELRETQVQLVQSEKMAALGQLVSGVAHEVNNSINFISGALPALRRAIAGLREPDGQGYPEPEELFADIDALLANIHEGARRASGIVRDLRDFSRVSEAEVGQADLHAGLDSTLALLEHECRGRIRIVTDYGADVPPVTGDPGQLNQVFMNLLLNAIQAIEGPGEIRVQTRAEAGRVGVTIRDSGPGIAPDVLPRIYDPFFTTKEVGKGTGLGLSVAYRIVAQHRGEIRAESPAGGGTVFHVVLPA